MKPISSKNGIFAIILIAVLVIFAGVIIMPANVAYAVLPDDYLSFVDGIEEENEKDWYFDENYLNIAEVLSVVNSWKTNPEYDFDAIKEDPVVIAVIDSGIGHAYYDDGSSNDIKAKKEDYYKIVDDNGHVLNYCVNPLFDDVILKDGEGKYVYASVIDKNVRGSKTCATLDNSVDNMAYVLADNTDDNHGTHVTGIVALLIHALELEDYVKIMPIKANDSVKKNTGATKYTAHYTYADVADAVDFAYENGADIVSMSLTADKSTFNFDEYCDDVLLCAAAGNNSSNSTFSPGYPAASSKVLGVMNYTYSDDGAVLSSKSNYGSKYDIAAPGSNIISTIDGKDGYGKLSGTSMATPIVAVASALISIRYNALIDSDLVMTPEIVRKMISLSSDKTNDIKEMPTLDLLSLITTDFQTENEDDIYVDAEGIYIDGPTKIEYSLKNLFEIKIDAKCDPDNSRVNGTIEWWYECGGQRINLGEGTSISFTPLSTIGTYAVYCRAVDDNGVVLFECSPNDAYVFSVVYETIDFDNVRIESADGKVPQSDLYENEPRTFVIKDMEFTEPYKYSIVWFVDGKMIKGATGSTFEFSTRDAGKHVVSARINGAYTYDVEFEVLANPEVNEKLPEYLIVTIVFSSIFVASVIALVVLFVLKKCKKTL